MTALILFKVLNHLIRNIHFSIFENLKFKIFIVEMLKKN